MRALERHVEAIVGPLLASEGRKDRMREELLAHLELAVEAERDRKSSDPMAAALSRFGSIEDVRKEIQDSVPAWERHLWTPVRVVAPIDRLFLFDPIRDRTALRFAARRTVSITILCLVVVSVTLAVANVFWPVPSKPASRVIGDVAGAFLALAAATFVSFYVMEKTGVLARLDTRHECSPKTQLLSLALLLVFWIGSIVALLSLIPRDFTLFRWVASWSFAGAGVLLGALSFGVWFTAKEASAAKERYKRWGTAPTLSDR